MIMHPECKQDPDAHADHCRGAVGTSGKSVPSVRRGQGTATRSTLRQEGWRLVFAVQRDGSLVMVTVERQAPLDAPCRSGKIEFEGTDRHSAELSAGR